MLDKDLARLYRVETGNLNKAVQRNMKRFPPDFMFQLTPEETRNLKHQIQSKGWGGNRRPPYAFTEQGVAMLSGVLSSDRAVQINVPIMRVFTEIRKMLFDNTELRLAIEEVRKKTDNNTKNIEVVFQYFDEMLEEKEKEKKKNSRANGNLSFKVKRKIGFRLPPVPKKGKTAKKPVKS